MSFTVQSLLDLPGAIATFVGGKLVQIFVLPGSFSVASLMCALCVAVLFLGLRRKRNRKPLALKVLLRAVFPKRIVGSASARADIGYFVLNVFLASVMIGWAVLSYHYVSNAANELLAGAFGARAAASLADWQSACVLTLALFLAYEVSYFVDHYLSHNIPFLWEFHKVHHSAEVLSPLTNFRVHPIDTLVFNNISALIMGLTGGAMNFALGHTAQEFTVANSNVIALAFTFVVGQLQHSHFWIVFPGIWGRLFLSPAHHQVHHSTDPAHFNRNLGHFLGVWDWLFGTLYVPSHRREKLTFGVEPASAEVHSVTQGMIAPVKRAWARVMPAWRMKNSPRRDARLRTELTR